MIQIIKYSQLVCAFNTMLIDFFIKNKFRDKIIFKVLKTKYKKLYFLSIFFKLMIKSRYYVICVKEREKKSNLLLHYF